MERGELEAASRELKEAISIDGHNAEAIAWLGAVNAAKQEIDTAAQLFRRVRRILHAVFRDSQFGVSESTVCGLSV